MAQNKASKRTTKAPEERLSFVTKQFSLDMHRQVRTATAEIWALAEPGKGAAGELVMVREEGCHAFYHVRVSLSGPIQPRAASRMVRRLLLFLGIYTASVVVTDAHQTVSFEFEA